MMITIIGRLLTRMVICGLLLVNSDCAPINHSLSSNNNSHVPSYLDAFKELIVQHVYGSSDDNNSSDSIENDDPFDLNSSREFLRAKRNAPIPDKLKELIDKSSTLARISNGIALQSGLMDGSIKIEDVVAELLNFGTLKVSDVVGFNVDLVKELTGKMEKLPTSLDKSTIELENAGLGWNELRKKSEAVKGVTNLTQKEAYFTALGNYEKSFDFDVFEEADTALNDILSKLKDIEELKIKEKPQLDDLKHIYLSKFIALPGFFGTAIGKLKEVQKIAKIFTDNTILIDSHSAFAPFGTMIELISIRYELEAPTVSSIHKALGNNFQQLTDLISKPVEPEIKGLSSLVHSRIIPDFNKQIYTSGFHNGIRDLKKLALEIRDPWIEEFTGNSISTSRLADGIQTLLNVIYQVLHIDDKLKPVSTNNNPRSIAYLKNVLQEVSKMPQKSAELVNIFSDIATCMEKSEKIGPANYEKGKKVIEKIVAVGKVFAELAAAVKRINIDQHQKDMNAFIKFLGFKDIKNATTSPAEIPAVMKRIKTTDTLKKFKELIAGVKNGFNIDKKALKADVKNITSQKDAISTDGFKEEGEMHACLQKLNDKFEKFEKAIGVTRKLSGIDSATIQNVENLASTVASVKNELKSLGSIPDSMKKYAKKITTEINKWPESLKSSGEIGQSVALLSHANDFKTLVSSGELDKFDAPVQIQIEAMKQGKEQTRIKTLWGDHNKFITDLKASSKSIDTISTSLKLAEIKTFEDYGTAMKTNLEAMKDVKIDVKAKIEALDALISSTKAPAELEKIKKTLQHLESLDLTFSSHVSHFQKVPNALKSLYDFLVKFSIEPTRAPPPRSGKATPEVSYVDRDSSNYDNKRLGEQTEPSATTERILNGVLIALIVALAFAVSAFAYVMIRAPKDDLRHWINRRRYLSAKNGRFCHDGYLNEIAIETEKLIEQMKRQSYAYLPERKHRNPEILCNPETALKKLMKDDKKMAIHANFVKSRNGKRFIACQAPTDKSKNHDDTTEDFWHMVVKERCNEVVMLCRCVEGGSVQSAEYYPVAVDKPKKCGRYEISLLAEPGIFMEFKEIIVRRMMIRDTTNKLKKRTITHYQHIGWKDQKCPPRGEHEALYKLMKKLESKWIPARFQSPVVVHCSSGIGRTMTFIGIHTVSEDVILDQSGTWVDRLKLLKNARWHAIQTTRQSYWLEMAVAHKLNWDYKLGRDEELKEQQAMFLAFNEQVEQELAAERQMEKDKKAEGEATTQKASSIVGQAVLQ
ncbi:hypothetical protein GCK72_015451 [Caenorhabditis remanei]|uniref:Tyrosine-protein phosphatase domain-containing protein n=1 Tax=Caenorhabditis remanei TaxID=31234 RepID=A0A6A5GWJ3_CAERE|nr:hypothetical protein GCK72_015451 [Caenorhabditis remanei]KAF1758991.1 hypothetical protein GCK72_015451 [Caenorhabditis remanei]